MEPKNKFRKSNRVLLDERPLVLLPSLAKAVGVAEAVVIQQLHFYLTNPDNGREHDGEKWIYKTYEDWQRTDFRFWSPRTIRRLFCSLEKKGFVKSCQPEGRDSRRKYYRIDYERLENFPRARAQEAAKSGALKRPKVALPLNRDDSTKTTPIKKVRTTRGAQTTANSDLVFEGKDKAIQGKNNLQDAPGKNSGKSGRENFSSNTTGYVLGGKFLTPEQANRIGREKPDLIIKFRKTTKRDGKIHILAKEKP